ncbi:MAG: gephyrin-like molybdotransferase Glp [Thermoflexales bacterium]
MPTFTMARPDEALALLWEAMARAPRALEAERVSLAQARGRVLAVDVHSHGPIPEFRRSTVDGFALRAADTGAGKTLSVAGEIPMGVFRTQALPPGVAIKIHTGGHVPDEADAVIMVERTSALADGQIRLDEGLTPGDNVIQIAEDVQPGSVVICAGAILREQEIGGLASLGISQAPVTRRPRVALISSGDELVPVESPTRPGQIRGSNAPMLAALVMANGGEPLDMGILPDNPAAFAAAAERAKANSDIIVFMAGSSMSDRDYTAETITAMGAPGILIHGIAFRPGKPTIFAVCDGTPVFGLPGNPNSALVTARRFLGPTLWRMLGATPPPPRYVTATLAEAIRSPAALEHWIPAALFEQAGERMARPIITKSNLIFGLVRAEGMFCLPIGVDGLPAGAQVQVEYFD